MLLKGLDVTNSRGNVLSLPLEDAGLGFVVKEIKGLEPVKATLVSSSFANMDGEQYHSSRRETRNIVITLGLDPDYAVMSVEELRKQLYSYFMPKSSVSMKFHMYDKFAESYLDAYLDLSIVGRIESFTAPLFTQEPSVEVSLMCFNPDFVDPTTVHYTGNTVSSLVETILTYPGSVDTGALFTFTANRSVSEFTIYHRPPDQTLRVIDFNLALVSGDVVSINSVRGNKYVTLLRSGTLSSVVYALTPQSAWLELQEGDNSIRVYATGAAIPYSIDYTAKYGGL